MDYDSFFTSELAGWPMAAENFARIGLSPYIGNKLQLSREDSSWRMAKLFADHRRASITANTSRESIAGRPCFLCGKNRPEEQSSMKWHDYEILVNPYPLSVHHLTIASNRHEPQALTPGRIADMTALAKELDGLCIFYNGPSCGASAPDHFHFQAVDSDMAANMSAVDMAMISVSTAPGATLYRSTDNYAPYPFFIIESNDDEALQKIFSMLMNAMDESIGIVDEAPVNIVMLTMPDKRTVRTIIIPRGKHRPECYSREEGKLLVSPATIEMLGTIVCSRKEDFDTIDLETAESILAEVGISDIVFNRIVQQLRGCLTTNDKP